MVEFRISEARSENREPRKYMVWQPIEQISPNLQKAVLAGEDSHFFEHHGFDWDAIQNAWDEAQKQAEKEGLAQVFIDAGFDWRESGCSMCVAMNDDFLQSGERCASTSNRNFEGRQGRGGRTHLASPAMVAAAAICGHFVDVRNWKVRD